MKIRRMWGICASCAQKERLGTGKSVTESVVYEFDTISERHRQRHRWCAQCIRDRQSVEMSLDEFAAVLAVDLKMTKQDVMRTLVELNVSET